MDEIIHQIAERVQTIRTNESGETLQPSKEYISEMNLILKQLVHNKEDEISNYNKMLCTFAHSVPESEIIKLIDLACRKCKKDLEQLEQLRSVLKTSLY